jgi:hypothetical protein
MRNRSARHRMEIVRGARVGFAWALLALASASVPAASVTSAFRVSVLLLPPFKDTACNGTTATSSVSVTCSGTGPGTPFDSRYLLHVYRGPQVVQTVDASMDSGTVTSWRVVHAANRDFLEIVVGW